MAVSSMRQGSSKQRGGPEDWTKFVIFPTTTSRGKMNDEVDTPHAKTEERNASIPDSPRSTNSTVDPAEEKSDIRVTKADLAVDPAPEQYPKKFEKPDVFKQPAFGEDLANGRQQSTSSMANGEDETSRRGSSDTSPSMSLVDQPQKRSKVHAFLMAPSIHHVTMRNYQSYLEEASSEYTVAIHPNKRHKPNTQQQQQQQQPSLNEENLPKGWVQPSSSSKNNALSADEDGTKSEDPPDSIDTNESTTNTLTTNTTEEQTTVTAIKEEGTDDDGGRHEKEEGVDKGIELKTSDDAKPNGEKITENEVSEKMESTNKEESQDQPQLNGIDDVSEAEKSKTMNWKKPKPKFDDHEVPYDLPKDPDEEPEEVWPKAEVKLSEEELEQIGEINGNETTLQFYTIATYFEADSRIRDAQKILQQNEYHTKIQNHLRRLKDQEECRRKLRRRRPPSNISIEGQVKDSLRSQVHLQEFKCWNCNKTLRIRGGGARYCEYTGKCYCARCHFGESAHIPAKIVHDLDVERYLICRASKSELDHVHEKPIIPRSLINSKLYFSNKIMQRLSIVQLQLTIMCNFIETCDQKTSLRKVLGTRSYFLYEDDLISIRDMVAFLNSNLVDRLEVAVKTYEKHITRECAKCCVKGFFCEYCRDPQPIFTFQIPKVLQCENCSGCFHTKCYDTETCPKCLRKQARERSTEVKI